MQLEYGHLECIHSFCELVKPKMVPGYTMAEIGVFLGETVMGYLPNLAKVNGHLYAVDHFCGNVGDANYAYYDPAVSEDRFQFFLGRVLPYASVVEVVSESGNIKRYNNGVRGAKVSILRMDSSIAAKFVPDKSLDFCFIDADHRYSNVKKDIAAYIPKIKSDGIIGGHDLEDHSLRHVHKITNKHALDIHDYYAYQPGEGERDNTGCHMGLSVAVFEYFPGKINTLEGSVWYVDNKLDKHVDNRGSIETILKNVCVDSVLKISSVKGSRRANHYHKTSGHFCVLTSGALTYYERPVGNTGLPTKKDILPGEVFWTGPMVEHLMVFTEDSEMWCYSTANRDKSRYEDDLVRLTFELDKV